MAASEICYGPKLAFGTPPKVRQKSQKNTQYYANEPNPWHSKFTAKPLSGRFTEAVAQRCSEKTGVDKFLSRRPTFRARSFTCAPDRARKNG